MPKFATRTEALGATGPETEKAEAEEADAQAFAVAGPVEDKVWKKQM